MMEKRQKAAEQQQLLWEKKKAQPSRAKLRLFFTSGIVYFVGLSVVPFSLFSQDSPNRDGEVEVDGEEVEGAVEEVVDVDGFSVWWW